MDWFIYSLITLVLWGLWGFILKLSYRDLGWIEVYFLSIAASFSLALTIFILNKGYSRVSGSSIYLPLIAGLCASIGSVFFNKALEKGEVSIVILLTALYPAVSIVLATIFLNEKLSLYQVIGIILAIVAIILLSIK